MKELQGPNDSTILGVQPRVVQVSVFNSVPPVEGALLRANLHRRERRERDNRLRALIRSSSEAGFNSDPQSNNYLAELWSGSEEGSYLGLIDCCITPL